MQKAKPSKAPARIGATKALGGGALALGGAKPAAPLALLRKPAQEPEEEDLFDEFHVFSDDEGTQKEPKPALSGAKSASDGPEASLLPTEPQPDAYPRTEPQPMQFDGGDAENEDVDIGDFNSGRGPKGDGQLAAPKNPAEGLTAVGASPDGSDPKYEPVDIVGRAPAAQIAEDEALGAAKVTTAAAAAAQTGATKAPLPEVAKPAKTKPAAAVDVEMAEAGGEKKSSNSGGLSSLTAALGRPAALKKTAKKQKQPIAGGATPIPTSGVAAQVTPAATAAALPEPQGPKKPAAPRSRLGPKESSFTLGGNGSGGGSKLKPTAGGGSGAQGATPQLQLGKPPAATSKPPTETKFKNIFAASLKKNGGAEKKSTRGASAGAGPSRPPAAAAAPSLQRQVLTKKLLRPAPNRSPTPFTPTTVVVGAAVAGGGTGPVGGGTGGSTPDPQPVPPADPLLALDFSSKRPSAALLTDEALAAETARNRAALAEGGADAVAVFSLETRLRAVTAGVEALHLRADEMAAAVARLGAACAVAGAEAVAGGRAARAAAAETQAAWEAAGLDDTDDEKEEEEDGDTEEKEGESMEEDREQESGDGDGDDSRGSDSVASADDGSDESDGQEGVDDDPEAEDVDIVGSGAESGGGDGDGLSVASLAAALEGVAAEQPFSQVEVAFDDAEMAEVDIMG